MNTSTLPIGARSGRVRYSAPWGLDEVRGWWWWTGSADADGGRGLYVTETGDEADAVYVPAGALVCILGE